VLGKVAELEIEADSNISVEIFMSDLSLLVKEGERRGGGTFHLTCLKLKLGSPTKCYIIFSNFLQFVVCELKLRVCIRVINSVCTVHMVFIDEKLCKYLVQVKHSLDY